MSNADIGRIINSAEVQEAIRAKVTKVKRAPQKKNPLTNLRALVALNPHAIHVKRTEILAAEARAKAKAAGVAEKRAAPNKARKAASKAFYQNLVRSSDWDFTKGGGVVCGVGPCVSLVPVQLYPRCPAPHEPGLMCLLLACCPPPSPL